MSFALAVTVGLGDLLGAFADAAESFRSYFDDRLERLRHAAGAYLLARLGLAFVLFAAGFRALGRNIDSSVRSVLALVTSGVFAALGGLAAAALSTVSMSVGFGTITGDPGIREAQHLLPQLGYVVLAVPGALAGGLTVWFGFATRTAPSPVGLRAWGIVAVIQLLAFYTLPIILLLLWTLAAALGMGSPPSRDQLQPSDP